MSKPLPSIRFGADARGWDLVLVARIKQAGCVDGQEQRDVGLEELVKVFLAMDDETLKEFCTQISIHSGAGYRRLTHDILFLQRELRSRTAALVEAGSILNRLIEQNGRYNADAELQDDILLFYGTLNDHARARLRARGKIP